MVVIRLRFFFQILDVKARIFTHKSTLGLNTANDASTISKPNKHENKDTSQKKVGLSNMFLLFIEYLVI